MLPLPLWRSVYLALSQQGDLTEVETPTGTCDPLCSVDEMSSEEYLEVSEQSGSDLTKAISIGAGISIVTALIQHSWVAENQV